MFLEGNTIDEWYNGFVEKVKGFYEMAFPVKRLKQKNAQRKLRWVTKGIRKSWETFKFLARLCRTSVDEKTKDYFKKYKKVFKRVMRKSKEMCNSKRIEKAVNKGEGGGLENN